MTNAVARSVGNTKKTMKMMVEKIPDERQVWTQEAERDRVR